MSKLCEINHLHRKPSGRMSDEKMTALLKRAVLDSGHEGKIAWNILRKNIDPHTIQLVSRATRADANLSTDRRDLAAPSSSDAPSFIGGSISDVG